MDLGGMLGEPVGAQPLENQWPVSRAGPIRVPIVRANPQPVWAGRTDAGYTERMKRRKLGTPPPW